MSPAEHLEFRPGAMPTHPSLIGLGLPQSPISPGGRRQAVSLRVLPPSSPVSGSAPSPARAFMGRLPAHGSLSQKNSKMSLHNLVSPTDEPPPVPLRQPTLPTDNPHIPLESRMPATYFLHPPLRSSNPRPSRHYPARFAPRLSPSYSTGALGPRQLGGLGKPSVGGLSGEPKAKRPWTAAEDLLLRALVSQLGPGLWAAMAQRIAGRTGKQVRERWLNHLSPAVTKRPWSAAEDATILNAHRRLGNCWSRIAKMLHGRSDNSVKNRFYTTLRRRLTAETGGNKSLMAERGRGEGERVRLTGPPGHKRLRGEDEIIGETKRTRVWE